MSYGRSPYMIIGTKGWHGDVIQFMDPQGSISRDEFPYPPHDRDGKGGAVSVTDEAMAQFIAHMVARGTKELQTWINRGAALDDDYTGFYATHPVALVRTEHKASRYWLQTKVTVKRRNRFGIWRKIK